MNKIEHSKKLLKIVGKTNVKYNLIEENDKVLVGLSGGKDSITLAHILAQRNRVTPFKFEFLCVTVDYGMGEDFRYLSNHCKKHGIPHEIIKTDIFKTAQEKIRENSSFCSFISRMRRGALYRVAQEKGFNKVALGHHLDDAVESFFMNFLYNGALRSMPPIYKSSNGLVVIRPLIMARERQLRGFSVKNGIDTIGDEACPAMKIDVKIPHARANTKELLKKLEEENPKIFVSLKASFEHIHKSSFFNKEDLEV
ncbi:MAG TPA: tRNA 2-thiocytidine biosynthesis protein TtcA [Campylobacterales bacterium]|nr:tRNA 2-thiocytidine biosynthesis protein TtcA [Campylobacterales bacterium]